MGSSVYRSAERSANSALGVQFNARRVRGRSVQNLGGCAFLFRFDFFRRHTAEARQAKMGMARFVACFFYVIVIIL